jgi:membrane-bound metal-dependent hydrolase YbcI (DUF457 family)
MPLPIAHSLVGASIVALLRPQGSIKRDWPILALGAFLAVTPDFDFFVIWGLNLSRGWHRGPTHSILVAVVATALMLIVAGRAHLRSVLACGAALLSHGILDFLATKEGSGVRLLWPLSRARLKLGLFGLSDFQNGFNWAELIRSLLIELTLFGPILLVLLLIREYLSSQASALHETQS